MPVDRPHRPSAGLIAYLLLAMAISTYLHGALSVLSGDLIEEFDLSRSEYGLAPALLALVAALTAPATGRMADRHLRMSAVILCIVAAAGTAVAAAGPVFGVVIAGAMLTGVGSSIANPVTNRIVAMRASVATRGASVGLKQTGPQVSLFIAGLTLPSIALWTSWRVALLTTLVLPVAALLLTRRFVPSTAALAAQPDEPEHLPEAPRVSLGRLAVISGTIAIGVSTMLAFIPLYGREELGMSGTTAGLLAAVMGIVGLTGRAVWAAFANRFWPSSTTLALLTALAALAGGILWASTEVQWLVWVGAVLVGASLLSWLSVAWVVLLDSAPSRSIGRHSGTQGLFIGLGFAAGPPALGAVIDASSYATAWAAITGLCVVALVMQVLAGR